MTSLYMAVKVYSTSENASALCASNLVLLSEGRFVEADIHRMEMRMLETFQWKLYPPTAACFLREYIQLLPYEIPELKHQSILDLSKFTVEIAVSSYEYVTYPPSVMAYAALCIALDCIPGSRCSAVKLLQEFEPFRHVSGCVNSRYPSIFDELRQSLVERPPYHDLMAKLAKGDGRAPSPRCKSITGVVAYELLNSPREALPWWDSMLFDL